MSSEMPWVKWWTESLDDPKFGALSDRCKWRFVEACLIAGECDQNGYLVLGEKPMTLADIAWRIRKSVEEIAPDYDTLINTGVIELCDDGAYFIPNFRKRQGRPQFEKREMWLERQNRHRENLSRVTKQDVTRDTSVTHASRGRGEKEEEKEKEEEEEAPPSPSMKFSGTIKGTLVKKLLDENYSHAPENFENALQRDEYLKVFERLNGELESVVRKGIAKGIRTRGDMLSWLQGCAKSSDERTSKKRGNDKPRKVYQ
jgi:hypothetical protein